MSETESNPKSAMTKRWRFQYSLRSLLLLVTTLCVLLGIHSILLYSAERQRSVVEYLTNAGVHMDYVIEIEAGDESFYPDWLVSLLGRDYFFGVESVLISSNNIPKNADVDALIAKASRLQPLERVRIEHCTLQRDSLLPLAGKSEMDWLSLSRSNADDNHIKLLAGMPKLRVLDLRGTKITDKSVKILCELKNLELLLLRDTNISVASIDQLRDALPDCDVDTTR